jgi:phage tail sheath protein FI
MASYLHPGVYIEEIPSGARPIEGVSTSVTAFVGACSRGPSGATLIGKFDDYVRDFGGVTGADDSMGLAVQAFYLNGGGAAFICRLAGEGSAAATAGINGQGAAGGASLANGGLVISAKNVGDWGNDIFVQIIKPDADAELFDLVAGHREDGELVVDEGFSSLSMNADSPDYALTRVNSASNLLALALGSAVEANYQAATLTGGALPDPNPFAAASGNPMLMNLAINGLQTEQISVTLSPGDDPDDVATAIEGAVQALGPQDAYQTFSASWSDATDRFTLTAAEDDSLASVEVFGGGLAELLRLTPEDSASITGAVVAPADLPFATSVSALGLADLTLSVDGHDVTLSLDTATLNLTGNNDASGAAIALAIQNAVRAQANGHASLAAFSAGYNAGTTRFSFTSGSSAVRVSGIQVTDGALADILGMNAADNPVATLGRQRELGTGNVTPIESLGLLDQGVPLTGGVANAPSAAEYGAFYANSLRKIRDVSIIVLPGNPWPASGTNPIITQTLAHCETMRNRMLIVDPPSGLELDQANTVKSLGLPTSTYTVFYYPWVSVANPAYDVDRNPTAPKTVAIAPSSLAAGQWARTDARRGVWKAPAGVETQLNGVAALQFAAEDLEQDQLNPLGVNVIRRLPGYSSVIWGSRTLATKASPEWRYVPVRRTAIFIEQSIYNGIQWAVFEPNDEPLWGSLRGNIGSFMNGLFRAGAFQGATSDQAYFVRCKLGDTMTQGDIDRGQVIVQVGFAPLKPAEFVIIRIQQKVGEQS